MTQNHTEVLQPAAKAKPVAHKQMQQNESCKLQSRSVNMGDSV